MSSFQDNQSRNYKRAKEDVELWLEGVHVCSLAQEVLILTAEA